MADAEKTEVESLRFFFEKRGKMQNPHTRVA